MCRRIWRNARARRDARRSCRDPGSRKISPKYCAERNREGRREKQWDGLQPVFLFVASGKVVAQSKIKTRQAEACPTGARGNRIVFIGECRRGATATGKCKPRDSALRRVVCRLPPGFSGLFKFPDC